MKHLFKLTCMVLLMSFIFSSCKTASLTKRRYNKGYYVSHSKKHAQPKAQEQTASLDKPEKLESLQATGTVSGPEKDAEIVSAPLPTQELANNSKESVKKNKESKPFADIFSYNELKPRLHLKPAFPEASSAGSEGGLSLIWILIVVLLVLYLVGVLTGSFGLGGLIHILGVVIVVLLILWLLRLI